MHMGLSTILYRLQHTQLRFLRYFGLGLVLINTFWLGLPAPAEGLLQGESWENAWTHTTWIYGSPYKSVIYSMPQVVDVGEGFVEYHIERVKPNAYWVDCPTSSFYIKTATTEVWSVNRTEQRLSKCIWQLWAYNGSDWLEIEDSDSSFTIKETDATASLEHYRVMEDSSTFNVSWLFGNRAKASVTLTAGQSRAYAITWHVECPKATTETLEGNSLTWLDGSQWLCLLDYYDASMFHNHTQVSALGQTGRKARITFANQTFLAGEQILIDPIVDTFYGMASYDGMIFKTSSHYPVDNMTGSTETSSTIHECGQDKSGSTYRETRVFYSFNTSTVANQTIERAELGLYCYGKVVEPMVSFNLRVYSGYYGTLDTGDWETCTTYQGILENSINIETQAKTWLLMDGDSSINATGLSQFRVASSTEEDAQTPSKLEYVQLMTANSANVWQKPRLDVYYLQEEEDEETKGTGEEGTGTGGGDTLFVEAGKAVSWVLSKTGLYLLGGSLIVVVAGGVYAGTKTKRVSRKARGKTGGGGSHTPKGTPKKRRRDARGRFT